MESIRILEPSMDAIPLNSTINIEDTDSETDMIELDSSCDAEVLCLDGNPINNPRNNENSSDSSPDVDVDADANTEVTTRSSRDKQPVSPNDDAARPVFKVMFRNESVSRYELPYILDFFFVCLQYPRGYVPFDFDRLIYYLTKTMHFFYMNMNY